MLTKNNTSSYQSLFASFCRTGNERFLSGVQEGRAHYYHHLVSNVILDTLSTAFPLSKKILTEDEWTNLLKEFMSFHTCKTPQVWRMPFEFVEFVKANPNSLISKYPFIIELLFFEWVEIEMFMDKDVREEYTLIGHPESSVLMVNPEIRLHKFNFPVHLKNASEIGESDRGEYYLSVHRHPESGKVYFTDLSPALVLLLEFLIEKPMKLAELTLEVAGKFNMEFNSEILQQVSVFIHKALENRLIIGYVKNEYDDN